MNEGRRERLLPTPTGYLEEDLLMVSRLAYTKFPGDLRDRGTGGELLVRLA